MAAEGLRDLNRVTATVRESLPKGFTVGSVCRNITMITFEKIIIKENQIVLNIKTAGIQSLIEEVVDEHQ